MVKVASVTVERWEGRITECTGPHTHTSFEAAEAMLLRWSGTAPEEGGGYHKCGFKVTWENGETYEGRIDLTRSGGSWNLRRHMVENLAFYTRCPGHMTEERWARFIKEFVKPETRAAAESFLTGGYEGIKGGA